MAFSFFKSLVHKFTGKAVDWDELEETLIRGDLGISLVTKILEELRAQHRSLSIDEVNAVVCKHIVGLLPADTPPMQPFPNKPKVILVVGVNGTGKTTSSAKLAHYLKSHKHPVVVAAADTFRAAAIEQLEVWCQRIGVELVKGQYNADPASLCFDAYQVAQRHQAEFLICDTAGRLHNRSNLMAELSKIKRSLAKLDPESPHERLLVIDATTGSNAVSQAKEFHAAVDLTGVIVTKLDGSGKGGVIVAIQNELGIPARFIGTGEKLENFSLFQSKEFVDNIL